MASIRAKRRPDGTTHYQAQVRVKGHPPQSASFERKTDAKRWGEQTEVAIRQRRYFDVFEAQRHTVSEMIGRFISDVLPNRPKQRRDLVSHLAWWKSEVGAYLVPDRKRNERRHAPMKRGLRTIEFETRSFEVR
jgi:hypothetical protein